MHGATIKIVMSASMTTVRKKNVLCIQIHKLRVFKQRVGTLITVR